MDKRVRYLDFLEVGCSGGYTLIGSDGQTLIIRYTDINKAPSVYAVTLSNIGTANSVTEVNVEID